MKYFLFSLFFIVLSETFVVNGLAESETNIYHCIGLDCPSFSLPERFDESNTTCNATAVDYFADPKDCHSYYYCSDNGTEIKLHCPEGYGYHEEWKFCVPEDLVQSCGAVYCPPYMFDGLVPDPKNCSAYYRCMYGFPHHYKCPKGTTFHPDTGLCKAYENGKEPDCVKKPEEPIVSTTTAPPETTTMEVPTEGTTSSVPTEGTTTQVPLEGTSSHVPTETENTTASSAIKA